MKKKRKKNKIKNKIKKKILKNKKLNRSIKKRKKPKTKPKKRIKKTIPKKARIIRNRLNANKAKKDSLALKLVKWQLSLKPELNFKINFSLEKYIQGFFDKISETISNYKILKKDEKRKQRLEKIEDERKAKLAFEKQKKEKEVLIVKLKEKELKEEARLEKKRTRDIKLFLKKEQAILRIEQAEKQKQFLKQLR